MNMRAGQVGCVTNARGFIGQCIQAITRSPAHHVVIGLDDYWCVSADPQGVRRRPITDFEHITWSAYPHTEQQAHLIAGLAEYSIGVRYNYSAIVVLAIAHLTRQPIPQPISDWLLTRGETTCSILAKQIISHVADVPDNGVPCPGDWLVFVEDQAAALAAAERTAAANL